MPTVDSNGTPIYYETKGQGAAIVFAHGAGGNAANTSPRRRPYEKPVSVGP